MTTPLSLIMELLPKLDTMGTNWTVFFLKFQAAMESEELWDHFDGSSPRPTPECEHPTEEETELMVLWDKQESKAKMYLNFCIPDEALIQVHDKPTVKDRWDSVVAEFNRKESLVQEYLCNKFRELRFPDSGNVTEFFDSVIAKREKLAACGVVLGESDCQLVISLLPPRLCDFASTLLASARLTASAHKIDMDVLFTLIVKESERKPTRYSCSTEEKEADGEGQDKNLKKNKKGEICWNCGIDLHCINCGERPL